MLLIAFRFIYIVFENIINIYSQFSEESNKYIKYDDLYDSFLKIKIIKSKFFKIKVLINITLFYCAYFDKIAYWKNR